MKENITQEQWNELTDSQKKEFQKVIGRKYVTKQFPSWEDIDSYLEEVDPRYNLLQSVAEGQPTPSQHDDIDSLWSQTKEHLS